MRCEAVRDFRRGAASCHAGLHERHHEPAQCLSGFMGAIRGGRKRGWAIAVQRNRCDAVMTAVGLGCAKTKSDLVVMLSGRQIFAFFALRMTIGPKIPGAVIPRRVFTQPGSFASVPGWAARPSMSAALPIATENSRRSCSARCDMYGRRPRCKGKESDVSANRSGAAMYPAFECSRCGCGP